MASITIRNVPEEVHRALRLRASQHGRSTEAEIRDILEQAAMPGGRKLMGDAMMEIWGEQGLTDQEAAMIEAARDSTPAEPMRFD
ncbi:plasmid stability protein [Sphingomonas zeicaulis]|uniref:FitA-like ribbon-helix-helix domain-containing protein n=1 Tax=Sphingomonas zeicaulis TaxID=1632740 RepID=UPI003D202B93